MWGVVRVGVRCHLGKVMVVANSTSSEGTHKLCKKAKPTRLGFYIKEVAATPFQSLIASFSRDTRNRIWLNVDMTWDEIKCLNSHTLATFPLAVQPRWCLILLHPAAISIHHCSFRPTIMQINIKIMTLTYCKGHRRHEMIHLPCNCYSTETCINSSGKPLGLVAYLSPCN